MPITITVRNARLGTVSFELVGDILMVFDSLAPVVVGQRLQLLDGTVGRVTGSIMRSTSEGVSQSVVVGLV
jgi:hypothetical protein